MPHKIQFATPEQPPVANATVKSYLDSDGDVTIEINGIRIGYLCCDTGAFSRYQKTGDDLAELKSIGIAFDANGRIKVFE